MSKEIKDIKNAENWDTMSVPSRKAENFNNNTSVGLIKTGLKFDLSEDSVNFGKLEEGIKKIKKYLTELNNLGIKSVGVNILQEQGITSLNLNNFDVEMSDFVTDNKNSSFVIQIYASYDELKDKVLGLEKPISHKEMKKFVEKVIPQINPSGDSDLKKHAETAIQQISLVNLSFKNIELNLN